MENTSKIMEKTLMKSAIGDGKTLIINVGSSSIKYRLYHSDKILLDKEIQRVDDFILASRKIFSKLKDAKINKVAYRVVYGGDFTDHLLISQTVLDKLNSYIPMAPLHMPQTLEAIEFFRKQIPAKHIACFDSVFFSKMPQVATLYPLPLNLIRKYHIKRHGFHGLAHEDMLRKAQNKRGKEARIITCQLGNGVSLAAIKNGICIDTSMGFTPLEGVMMGTRSGNIDPAIVEYLCKKEKKSVSEITNILQKESGFKGLTGSSDVRDVLALKRKGKKEAKAALDLFCYQIRKYIGAYMVALEGLDAIVFSGGISHSHELISRITKGLPGKKLVLDSDEEEIMYNLAKLF